MSNEKPTDDPWERIDWRYPKHERWKGPVEKERKSGGTSGPDLEKWHDTNTH